MVDLPAVAGDPGVAIAILTWRGEDQTRACLQSIRGAGIPMGRLVVVDNGSGTGEGARLAEESTVAHVTLTSNGGVPAGYNAAIAWAQERGATHVLLANNDLLFSDSEIVDRLALQAGPGVAAVGPLIRDSAGGVSSAGGRLRRWLGHVVRTTVPWSTNAYDVDTLDGSCMLVSIDAVCCIGGLAPEFFLYWEESDWCTRARAAGLRLRIEPAVSVTHVGLGSGNLRQTRRYALRNSLLFIRRNIGGGAGVSAGLVWLFGKLPFFVVRRLVERADPKGVLQDAGWAISYHLRDIARHGWRRAADGPDLCR